ncbi:MAG: hypothetical protein ACKOCO_02745, partial [Bacteroidota bacterium]
MTSVLISSGYYFFGNKYWVTTRNNPSTFNVVVVIRATKTVSESLYQPLPVAMIIQMIKPNHKITRRYVRPAYI